jgi:outer membrane receptor protein involved in Fe transport
VAGYVQDTWKPTPRWQVQPGVRLSYFSGGPYMHVRPRLSARFTAHPDYLVLRAAVGAHVQYLHRLRDRYSLAYDLVSSRWVPSSSRVDPASSMQATLSAQSSPLPRLTVDLTAYGRTSDNILIPADIFRTKDGLEGPGIEVGALLGQYTPAQERALGLELNARYEWRDWRMQVGGAAGRTFVRALDAADQGYRPADLDVPVSVRSSISWTRGPWLATVAAEARSGYPQSVPVARYKVGDPIDDEPITYLYRPQANNGRLPTYARLDASLGYQFGWLDAGWTATFGVYNLTNRRNIVARRYSPTETGVETTERSGLPFLPLLEIEVTL